MKATKYLTGTAIGLCFLVAFFLFFHNLTTINEDIGRHIKLGEIIWQTKSVPHTNLLSYTATNFPFINHHWLSEVVFYGFYNLGGFEGVMIVKIVVLLAAYLILFLIVKNKLNSISILSFVISLTLISMRTDPRPEIFTYLILAIFLFIIYRVREDERKINILWLLPLLELFWVNLHIYFVIGYALYGAFLLERFFLKKPLRREVLIGFILALTTLINPNGFRGALYPLTIFKSYSVSIAENVSILEFVKYYHVWVFPYKLFLASIALIIFGIILQLKLFKQHIFEMLLFVFLTISSFQLSRNIGIYAIFSFPATAVLFNNLKIKEKFLPIDDAMRHDRGSSIFQSNQNDLRKIGTTVNKIALGGLILFMAFFINSIRTNAFYEDTHAQSRFGLAVPKFMEQAVDFFQKNKLPGPIFNDLGIGSYLEWKLYPEQKAFSDDRPEAYPASFWKDVYKPMETDHKIWQQKSTEYGIRSVVFDHTAMDPAGQKFLFSMLTDPDWPLIFVNDRIVIFVKKSKDTQQLIDNYKIDSHNIESRVKEITDTFDTTYDLSYRNLGDFLYKFGQYQASLIPYQKLIDVQPENPYGYERHVFALMVEDKDGKNVDLALAELQKAISLGANDANAYLVLASILSAKKDLPNAQAAIKKAYRLNPYDEQIKSLYSKLIKQS